MKQDCKGQTLISLLFFIIIGTTVAVAAVGLMIINSSSASKLAEGTRAYYAAESGAENGLLRFLRNPSYTGETLPIDTDGSAVITVSGNGPYLITSKGTVGNYIRTIQVTVTYTNNVMTVVSWKEI